GDNVKVAPELAGLDFNRNFPYDWQPQADQDGAGDYPASEPEIRAAVQAIVERSNICLAVSYHTFGAVQLRPYSAKPAGESPPAALRAYTRVSDEATRRTGYPHASIYHHFSTSPRRGRTGHSTTGSTSTWACSPGRPSSGARCGPRASTSGCASSTGG